MGFLDRLFGRTPSQQSYQQNQGYAQQPTRGGYRQPAGYQQPVGSQHARPERTADEQAIARYRYLLRTAPPEAVEQAHAEAFAQLTPEQRRQVLAEMSKDLPAAERPTSDDPQTLARTATRAEMRQPGYMERAFGGGMGGMGMGGMSMGRMIGGSMLGTIAGVVIGSAVADMFMDGFDQWDHDTFGGEQEAASFDQDGSMDANGDGYVDGAGDQAAFGDTGGDVGGDGGFDLGGGTGFDFGGFDGGFDGGGFDSF